MNIIEPCCCERQLGALLREERGHAAVFQTNGDVTLDKFLKATLNMIGDRPRTLTLCLADGFSPEAQKVIARYLCLGWIERLCLMTPTPLTAEALTAFAALVTPDALTAVSDSVADTPSPVAGDAIAVTVPSGFPAEIASHLDLAADAALRDDALIFDGPQGTLAVYGRLPLAVTHALTLYAATLGRTDSPAVRAATDALRSRFRARRYELPATATVVSDSPADTSSSVAGDASADKPKKPRTHKTKKQ